MADLHIANILEGAAGAATLAALFYKPVIAIRDRRHAKTQQEDHDDIFLHGVAAVPGLHPKIEPAWDRLGKVEVGVDQANTKLDEHASTLDQHTEMLGEISTDLRALLMDSQITVKELQTNGGDSIKDKVNKIATQAAGIVGEQSRVADELATPIAAELSPVKDPGAQ